MQRIRLNLIKKAVLIGIGVGMGPLVQLVATPWLSRIYNPTDFGYFALFVSSVNLLSNVACLRYETAIPVVESGLIKPIARIALLSTLVTMSLAMLVISSGVIQNLYPLFRELDSHIWWMPLAATCGGSMLLVYYLTLRRGEFILNAVMRSLQPIIFVLLAVFLSKNGLLTAQITSWLFVVILGLFYLRKDIFPFERKGLWLTAVKFRDYPILLTPTSLLDAVALTLPILFIGSVYGVDATGNYSQIQRLIGAPLLLCSAVLGQMFFKYSGELYRAGKSSNQLFWQTVKLLLVLAFLLLLLLMLIGEPACKLLLGGSWRVDTPFLLLATIPFLCRSVVSPISTVFLTHHRVNLAMRWQVGYFITTYTLLYYASKSFNFEHFLLIYGIHEIVMYGVYLAMANRVVATSVT